MSPPPPKATEGKEWLENVYPFFFSPHNCLRVVFYIGAQDGSTCALFNEPRQWTYGTSCLRGPHLKTPGQSPTKAKGQSCVLTAVTTPRR